MDKKQKAQLTFAVFDGIIISLGAVIALVAANLSKAQVFAIIAGLATSTAVGLAWSGISAGESEPAIANAMAIFAGIILPALPFIFWRGWFALIVLGILLFAVCQVVGSMRGRDPRLTHDIYRTVLFVIVAVFVMEWAAGGIN